ncbi:MAG TPA: methyltransferase domain-containing protein [Burkholderiales bacterium]|nr:methyltransferase domain-containing protein [Burkholderiales bacterium]
MKRCFFVALWLLTGAALAQEGEQTAPFVTTPADVVVSMLRFAGTGPSDLVVDLGSGDGRIPITAAAEFGARGLGIEIDAALVEESNRNARAAGVVDRVRFVHADVLREDFSQASVVTVYLLPALINRLQPKLLDDLRPGTRIVSHAFAMVGWPPDRTHTLRLAQRHERQGDHSTIHLWVVPAKARGRWTGSGWDVVVHQNFQQIEVEARRDGRPVAVTGARLSGEDITWDTPAGRFRGRVGARAMTGTFAGAPLALEKR